MKKDKLEYGFGPHLMLDCFDCDREKLADMDLIFDTLDKLPSQIGMTKIMPPYVFKYQGTVPDDWGISGVVLIAESHISIHTFPDKNHAFMDIFSCKSFDTAAASLILIDLFKAARHDIQLLSRGAEFPRSIRRSSQVITREREAHAERPRVYN